MTKQGPKELLIELMVINRKIEMIKKDCNDTDLLDPLEESILKKIIRGELLLLKDESDVQK